MKKMNSSHIDIIHYEPSSKTCMVKFHNGKMYHYQNMTEAAYKAFENAKSPGQHFRQHILGKYSHRKS